MSTTVTFILYIALIIMPPPITFGLPTCTVSTTGLTERYDPVTETLYVDECWNGTLTRTNLPVVDMTTSVVVIETSKGLVTVQLPQLVDHLPYETAPTAIQSSSALGTQSSHSQDELKQQFDCNKVKLFLDDCLTGPRP